LDWRQRWRPLRGLEDRFGLIPATAEQLLAEPVLYLDGFGVATGALVPFAVVR
jgi:hypothetical protein